MKDGQEDFFMSDNKIELLEINTIPGMTDHSLVKQQKIWAELLPADIRNSRHQCLKNFI